MRKDFGFTLIELIIFIIITSILASAILLSFVGSMGKQPTVLQNTIATYTARQCADWYLAQRRLNGFSGVSGANCTDPLGTPAFCTTPAGYTLRASCATTTVRGDSDYVTITIAVTGDGSATLNLLLGAY